MRFRPGDTPPTTRLLLRRSIDDFVSLDALARSAIVAEVCQAFFEREWFVISADMNVLVGDSYWHSDDKYDTAFLRFVAYLEPLSAGTGALRFLPASHMRGSGWEGNELRQLMRHKAELGLPGADVPAHVVQSQPGDLVVFDTNVLHSSWCGSVRRQLAFNVCGVPRSPGERADVTRYILKRHVSGTVLM
jgi:hypothetical protein